MLLARSSRANDWEGCEALRMGGSAKSVCGAGATALS